MLKICNVSFEVTIYIKVWKSHCSNFLKSNVTTIEMIESDSLSIYERKFLNK